MAAVASGLSIPSSMENLTKGTPKIIKPKPLKKGMKVALVAPSSSITEEFYAKVIRNMEFWGLIPLVGKHVRDKHGFLAGTDADRLADLHWAFENPEAEAVWCVRGGYGATRILDSIDYKLIKRNPKPLIGYSDITALHIAIHQRTGLVTFHGPVAGSDYPENTIQWFKSVLTEPTSPLILGMPKDLDPNLPEEDRPHTIVSGKSTGRLTGGNLCLLAAMVGTKFSPEFKDKIVFIEDIGEQPYRIDRMLTQLLQGTDLSQAAGIALGVFNDCKVKGESPSLTLLETFKDRLGNLGIPVVYGIPFGHVSLNATLPLGLMACLDSAGNSLTLLENI